MAEAAETFTARIVGPDGTVGGLGALVADRHVVTCAHVVNSALRLPLYSQPWPRDPVRVEFPLLDGGGAAVEAEVVKWLPPSSASAAGDDIAGLELRAKSPLPARAAPARLAVEVPRLGHRVFVFGYPNRPPRPDGGRVATTVLGLVGNGRLQLDSAPESALRVQPGFSGSPVFDDATGRIVGLLALAAESEARDSYAISVDRLRLAWPEILACRWQPAARAARGPQAGELTILHVSDLRFERDRLPGASAAERAAHPLYGQLHADLAGLADAGLRPDLLVVSGNLAEQGLPVEFQAAAEFIVALAEEAEIPRRHVAIVPGDHDVNRRACQAYFLEQESNGEEPVPPYWPKWRQFAMAFREFYAGIDGVSFTPDEPWTLFEMPELKVAVAGLNSTMADSHLAEDQYGWVGVPQLQWFRDRLARYRAREWLRIAAVHHSIADSAAPDDEHFRDGSYLDKGLGRSQLVNLLLHGHTPEPALRRLSSGLIALSAGDGRARYQFVTIGSHSLTRSARQYAVGPHRWVGDDRTRPKKLPKFRLTDASAAVPPPALGKSTRTGAGEKAAILQVSDDVSQMPEAQRGFEDLLAADGSDFFKRVADTTRARVPGAIITERPDELYLRVTVSRDGGRVDQWPVGVIDGPATGEVIDRFVERVHHQFAADVPEVQSELVYRPPAVSAVLVDYALRRGVLLRSLVEYQGLLDLTPLADTQRERLASDRIYPARLYVDQRYRIISGGGHTGEVRTGLIDRAVRWLGTEGARLVVVLGDFGRGKTSFLRQLTRVLPGRLPSVMPVLVELRSLEKAPSLDELLAQHLARQGVEDINLGKLRHMINSGRIVLLLDGFDELELRVGYDNAADYLQRLITAVTGEAKVILTSRTQHFRSTKQVRDALSGRLEAARTELGDRVETRPESRVVVLEEFSDEQIIQFLTNLYEGDAVRARARFDLISGIGNLLDLAHNPRMLGFVAGLEEDRLRDAQDETGQISAATLFKKIIDQWLEIEAQRHQHQAGLPFITKEERLDACTVLALRLWGAKDPVLALQDLSAGVTGTLTGLAERGFTEDQATHSIASGSLLVRTDDGAFTFIHHSIMEWLVADAAAADRDIGRAGPILASRRMSRLMAAFFVDLAGHERALDWAGAALEDGSAPEAAKQNALAVMDRMGTPVIRATVETPRQNLAGVDLRGQDLTGRDLRGAILREANLRGMRLADVDLSGADLTGAYLTGVVMTGGSLHGAVLTDSKWDRAAILGTRGVGTVPELTAGAVAGRDPAEIMVVPAGPTANCVAFSPDGTLLAFGEGTVVKVAAVTTGRILRVLRGHSSAVYGVTFSPDGTLIATASFDWTARTWDTATGEHRATLTGHNGYVEAIAFSPDGALIATASDDKTARTWDTATGEHRATLTGHDSYVNAVAFSPDGTLIATAASDYTARTWDTATGEHRATLTGHNGFVYGIAFSPDGALIATAAWDNTARTWDSATGTHRTTLTGHDTYVNGVAFSPDGTLIATAANDKTARTWDTATGEHRATLTGHDDSVWSVAFSPDGTLIATAAFDRTVRTWDTATGTHRTTLTGHDGFVNGVAFSPDGTLIATAASDYTPRTWDTATGRHRTAFTGHDGSVRAVAFSPDGALIATASSDKTARTWDTATGEHRATLTGHDGSVRAVAFSPDGTLIATAAFDQTARTWDTATGEHRATLTGHGSYVEAVAFSPDGALIATASNDKTARTWDSATGRHRATLTGHDGYVNGVAFSPDGALIATASSDQTARTWDAATGRHRATLTGHDGYVNGVAFSPDGALIATASFDRTARTWDSATGTHRATFTGHDSSVQAVAFSPSGALIATASSDGTTRIWDTHSGTHLVTLIALPDGGYVTLLPGGAYKLKGDPRDRVWWAIKLCRFEAGELDPYVPALRRLADDEVVIPPRDG